MVRHSLIDRRSISNMVFSEFNTGLFNRVLINYLLILKNTIMKTLQTLLVILLLTITANSFAQTKGIKKDTIKVWGNCEKCKTRIETAAKINGVSSAEWNIDSKLLKFKVDTTITTVNAVLKSVAHAGHDNEVFFADDYAYSKLPESCQYERRTE